MSQYNVKCGEYWISYGWDPVPPMRTFFLRAEHADRPEEFIVDVGAGLIFGDSYTEIDKFTEACTKKLQDADIDFELSPKQQFQLLDDMLFV